MTGFQISKAKITAEVNKRKGRAFGLRVWDEVDKRRDAMYTRESRDPRQQRHLPRYGYRPTDSGGWATHNDATARAPDLSSIGPTRCMAFRPGLFKGGYGAKQPKGLQHMAVWPAILQ